MIGKILRQRYQIIKQLGAGGFGETYLAEDLDIPVSPKPVCVVKRLQPTVIDPEIIRLFEQEAQILYQLGQNHDQIPKLYAYFQEDQDFYLIQEFIEGNDLTNEIYPGKKLGEGEVIQLLRDVLEILVYVHENKVIHRDIKPANIMRRKDGNLVLIDFGVVKQINTTIAMKSGFTSKTVGVGTHGYMPPEQGFGKPKLSSDIYSLGMMAIEGLTGISLNTLSEDEEGEIIWSNLVAVSNQLENFITKLVRYDWRERYRDGKAALEELSQVFVVIQQQNVQPVTPILNQSITTNKSSQYYLEEGNKLLNIENYEQAILCYDKAIAIQPDCYQAWHFRGVALHELKNYEKALISQNKAISFKPDYYEAWAYRGAALSGLEIFTEAIESCNKSIDINSNYDISWLALGYALSRLQKHEEAMASYDKAICINPNCYKAWNNRGFWLSHLKKYEEAITSYNKAIAIKPDYPNTWINRGLALNGLKKYKEAILSYDKAIAINPDLHKAWFGRGSALEKLEKYEDAILSYDKSIAITPDYHEVWFSRGYCLDKLQKYEDAISSYDQAITIKPDYYKAWYNWGVALKNLKKYEEAISSFDKVVAIKPDYHEAWFYRGYCLNGLKKYEEAIASYDKAIAIQPDHDYAWNNRGLCLENLQRYEEALKCYEKAIIAIRFEL